jgi:hypothetical protein
MALLQYMHGPAHPGAGVTFLRDSVRQAPRSPHHDPFSDVGTREAFGEPSYYAIKEALRGVLLKRFTVRPGGFGSLDYHDVCPWRERLRGVPER